MSHFFMQLKYKTTGAGCLDFTTINLKYVLFLCMKTNFGWLNLVHFSFLRQANHPRFVGENLNKNKEIYHRIESLAKKHQTSPIQLALSWVLHQGNDVVPIPGESSLIYNWHETNQDSLRSGFEFFIFSVFLPAFVCSWNQSRNVVSVHWHIVHLVVNFHCRDNKD